MTLVLYNSLASGKEEFKSLEKNKVKMYVCGPTVYGPDHLGHGRIGVFYDVLRNYLEYKGYQVNMAQNITDVGHLTGDMEDGEDKIEKEAKKEGKTPRQIADYYTKRHFNDMAKLNVGKPTFNPKATDYIPQMIQAIEDLIDKGYAYESGGNVYFDVSKFKNYGKLSRRKTEEMIKEVRVEKDKNKDDPLDFALWLKADNHLQKWESPWGVGYPGWHLECSVMNKELFGKTIDIHGGANELSFPHHENEIAQSEAWNNADFVRYWVHIGLVQVDGRKMGKSNNNFITLRELLKEHNSDQIRLALLTTHWRKPFDYSEDKIDQAQTIINQLIKAKANLKKRANPKLRERFEEIMDNNINTPRLITFLVENLENLDEKLFNDITNILGLKLEKTELPKEILKIANQRKRLRKNGKYKEADIIRKKIEEKGYKIEDTEDGYEIWKK
jgi:cysteinyl-tRNA synthetase